MLEKNSKSNSQSILDHLVELRSKILLSFAFIIGLSIIAHVYHEAIIAFILEPTDTANLIFLSPLDPLFFVLKIDFLVGCLAAFPLISWMLLSYIKPAMERPTRVALVSIYSISILFLIFGIGYTYFVTVPISLRFLFSIHVADIHSSITASSYLSFLLAQLFIITLIFQIPVIIIAGTYLRLLSVRSLASKRRYIYVGGTILLAIITPTTDLFNLGIVLIPAVIIFETSLIAGRIVERLVQRKKA